MTEPRRRAGIWLAAIVIVHFGISLVHGMAHAGARVGLSTAANLFVFIVILAGPLIGLVLQMAGRGAAGARVIAAAMTGSLVFGVVNHFVLSGADHISQIDPAWRIRFATSAILLAVTEAAGTLLAIGLLRRRDRLLPRRDDTGRSIAV